MHCSTGSRIVSSWTDFLYRLLGSKRLWVPSEVVRAHLPPELFAFADTQVVLDCTEIFCQTPSSLLLQSEVFSSYKSHAAFKAMIGMAPQGAMTPLCQGFMQDPSFLESQSCYGQTIMVDKGFLVDNIARSREDVG